MTGSLFTSENRFRSTTHVLTLKTKRLFLKGKERNKEKKEEVAMWGKFITRIFSLVGDLLKQLEET